MEEYSVIFDVLRDSRGTFPRGLFPKKVRFTRVASMGGHWNATHSALSVGVNYSDPPQTKSDLLFPLQTLEPWMVSVAFPCAPFSRVREIQRAQGMGDWVGDMIEEFRPLVDFSAA
eukprot:9491621-Pyramimonas_sp.AAC.1